MGFLKWGSDSKEKSQDTPPQKSIYFSNRRIDRQGRAWKRKSFWFREVYLGKLKVMAHFQDTDIQVLIDRAIGAYIAAEWDRSGAVEKMVKKSSQKAERVKA
ncbi:MAG: hypothetical protein JSU65_08365 [Candidatus Zixiibacteriota bacterium]|nr:MAG: hypothetical protein JSU65_08365 [candidate division Zixibacteria bacterium]